MKQNFRQRYIQEGKRLFNASDAFVRACLVIIITNYSLLITHSIKAQGLPLIRNFTAAEYGGHNRCYDIEMDEDGTVYVANFEGP